MTDKNTQPVETTTVEDVDVNLQELLGGAGAANVMTAPGTEKKPSIFSKPGADTSFLDKSNDDEEEDPSKSNEDTDPDKDKDSDKDEDKDLDKNKKPTGTQDIDDVLNSDKDQDKDKDKKPKLNKANMVQAITGLVKKGVIKPFDDEKPIEEYSVQDLEELIEVNFSEKEKELREKTPVEFFDALPEEMQYAAKYIMDGGQDLKGLFRVLAQVEETKELDPKTNSEEIARRYLTATNFGTSDDIEEEITAWKDRGELEKKAEKFKPKLDAMHQQQVQMQLKQQEDFRKKQAVQAQAYMQNIYNVLEPGTLNGLKLDKKTQSMLYTGLVNPSYPSVSGRPTNMLGHLLEKYQFVEPNHSLVAEALWLLADPDGYKAKIKESAGKETNEKTLRMLKTEQSNKKGSSVQDDDDENSQRKPGTIKRPGKNIFSRE